MACMMAPACGGSGQTPDDGSGSPAFERTAALTLAWDQPDRLADYYLVKAGATMLRVEETRATLTLTVTRHVVDVTSCNDAGCSAPATVTIDWIDNGWTLASQ
jgi:hypothetical protein